jgi:hypothetical protein
MLDRFSSRIRNASSTEEELLKNRCCFLFLVLMVCMVLHTDQTWSVTVDIAAAYMTAFGRTATPAEIGFWQTRLPATQAELVNISVNWLVSPRGAKELTQVVVRGFQAAFSRQPTPAEQQEWESKIKESKMSFAVFLSALSKGYSGLKYNVVKVPETKKTVIQAFPANATAPVVFTCPEARVKYQTEEAYPISRKDARFNKVGTIICRYTCPDNGECGPIVGTTPGTTQVNEGCQPGLAWCESDSDSGFVALVHETNLTCWGGPEGVTVYNSPTGRFLCW